MVRVSMDVVRAMGRFMDAYNALDLDAILKRFRDNNEDLEILVADDIPMETWNRFCETFGPMDRLPRELRLQQFVWAAEKVWLVEFNIGPHGRVARYCDILLDRQLGDLLTFVGGATLFTPN
ncbi:hypothetical protein V7S43_002595 [Phytophthora oleae]|uniref:SnoaL-like domain-containing protein n=1 Tax=Phytophthora oleae TaxID=2107226 RepID=A0ABD3FYD6_9STRA